MFVSAINHADTRQRNNRRNPEFRNAVSKGHFIAVVGCAIEVFENHFCFKIFAELRYN